MNQIVENLTRKPDPLKRFYRVVKPLAAGRYQVQDSLGRPLTVDASETWNVGAGVTVSQGRIVGSATKFINPKIYEV